MVTSKQATETTIRNPIDHMETNTAIAKSATEEKPLPTSEVFELIEEFSGDTRKFVEALKAALDSLSREILPRDQTTLQVNELEEESEKLEDELAEAKRELERVQASLEEMENFVNIVLQHPDADLRRKLEALSEALRHVKKDKFATPKVYIERKIIYA